MVVHVSSACMHALTLEMCYAGAGGGRGGRGGGGGGSRRVVSQADLDKDLENYMQE